MIEINKPGTPVWLKRPSTDVQAVILAVMIRDGGRVLYQVAWWAGETRHEQWVEVFEFTESEAPKQQIGFKPGGGGT